MRAVLQRVKKAHVSIDQKIIGEIEHGLVILLGVENSDTEDDLNYLVDKCHGLRIFSDTGGKFNLSLSDVKGSILCISQFTLFADCKKGRRPSFIKAGKPVHAKTLYTEAIARWRSLGVKVATGEFGADMQVSLVNDGPVTIIIDSKDR